MRSHVMPEAGAGGIPSQVTGAGDPWNQRRREGPLRGLPADALISDVPTPGTGWWGWGGQTSAVPRAALWHFVSAAGGNQARPHRGGPHPDCLLWAGPGFLLDRLWVPSGRVSPGARPPRAWGPRGSFQEWLHHSSSVCNKNSLICDSGLQHQWSFMKESFGPRKESNSLKGPLLNHLTVEKTKLNFSSILMLQASCTYLGLITPCPETYHPLHPPRRLITPCPTTVSSQQKNTQNIPPDWRFPYRFHKPPCKYEASLIPLGAQPGH